ncbi:MAG: 2-hydroxychromene-2-carboxylate isomerase [Mizugakiibacter sp.]|uniref:2-hydroxychromene-2-carboxylate isomerase n=1 Tax=Mizugakiibacter sp. TaxID=1972610 RepID=UPI0031BFB07D|nr:2-hydroxychromene-2-carboxylate isomerase [Xanthomonadaceae bacterium]
MQARWYFDFVSPFSYLQLARLGTLRARLAIEPVPIVFGAVLKANGTLGPAEIASKRAFTYRFVQWQAERAGLPLAFPPAHPFNPLAALRLCIAAGGGWDAVASIFDHFWKHGRAGETAAQLAVPGRTLGIADVGAAIADPAVKAALRANTDEAIAAGVYGVPTVRIGDTLFWGNDATPMLEDWLARPQRFDAEAYRRLAALPVGTERPR